MSADRRDFLRRAGMLTVAGALAPRTLLAAPPRTVPAGRRVRGMADPNALAAAALDAARQAGASYADVRLTFLRSRSVLSGRPAEAETLGFGVRVLVNGYWGFASSPLWSQDEAARLGREAVAQGRANALGKDRVVELGTIPKASGEWTTPIRIEPFDIATSEILDWVAGYGQYGVELKMSPSIGVSSSREQRVFASSEGAACTQTVYTTNLGMTLEYKGRRWPVGVRSEQAGWELILDAPMTDLMVRTKAEIDEDDRLPVKPVEVGRYDVAFNQSAMATLLGNTLGYATELDRALGYEANAGGTSYLNAPLEMLGSYKAGAPQLTVTAERSRPGSLATTKWDDEGVAPEPFTIIQDGQLVDFQTTRESAAWLAPWYAKRGEAVHSHGCARAPSALDITMQHTPNLAMRPAAGAADFDDLVGGMSAGLAVRELVVSMDQQRSSGLAENRTQTIYEVKRGKRVAIVAGAAMLFRSTDLWRNLVALGGAKSLRWLPAGRSEKGEPSQTTSYTIGAVPGVCRNVTIIDPYKKA